MECRGYTGADLAALVREAGIIALKEYMLFGDTEQALVVSTDHFKKAVSKIRPSVPDKVLFNYYCLIESYCKHRSCNKVSIILTFAQALL